MSQHSGDYEDFLRGALHAAVDSVEPAGDGLERIRARLTTPRPLPVAWLMAACSWVATYARGSLDSVSAWLQTVPRPLPVAWLMAVRARLARYARVSLDSVSAWLQTVPRALARPGGAGERSQATERQRQLDRLRLIFTVAAVTILMAVSVSALTPFGRHVLSQAGAALTSIGGGEAAGTGEPGASGPGSGAAGAGVAGATHGGQGHGQPATSCPPGTSALAVPPASPGTAASTPADTTTPASPSATSTTPASAPAATTAPAPSPSPASSAPA